MHVNCNAVFWPVLEEKLEILREIFWYSIVTPMVNVLKCVCVCVCVCVHACMHACVCVRERERERERECIHILYTHTIYYYVCFSENHFEIKYGYQGQCLYQIYIIWLYPISVSHQQFVIVNLFLLPAISFPSGSFLFLLVSLNVSHLSTCSFCFILLIEW